MSHRIFLQSNAENPLALTPNTPLFPAGPAIGREGIFILQPGADVELSSAQLKACASDLSFLLKPRAKPDGGVLIRARLFVVGPNGVRAESSLNEALSIGA